MENAAIKFWNWFQANNAQYLFVNQVGEIEKQRLLNMLLEKLHNFCEGLWFEIGGHPEGEQELIITAEGDIDYFLKVEELLEQAPKLKGWSFVAFKPAMGIDFNTVFEDVRLVPAKMWFLPLNHPDIPASLGLRICLPNYEEVKQSEWLTAAVFQVLDTVLGEKSFALDIDHVEIQGIPEQPEQEGLMELQELPRYTEWHKEQKFTE